MTWCRGTDRAERAAPSRDPQRPGQRRAVGAVAGRLRRLALPAVTAGVLSQYQRSTRTYSLPAHLVDRAKSMNLASSSLAAPCPAAASGLSR